MNKNILILDDDLKILDLIKRALRKQNYTVIVYSDPYDAFEYFRDSSIKYDLIVTDIEMPIMTGHEFIDKVKEIEPDIKTIGMSGSRNIDFREERFSNFIEKPFKADNFRQVIADTLLI